MLGLVFAGYYERCRNNNRSALSIHLPPPPFNDNTKRRGRKRRFSTRSFLHPESKLDSNITLQGREKKNNFQILKRNDKLESSKKNESKEHVYISDVFSKAESNIKIKRISFVGKLKKKNRKTYPKPAVSFQIPLEEFYREIKIEAVDRLATSRRTPPRSNLKGETHAAFTRYVVTLDAVRHPGEYRPPRLLGHRGGEGVTSRARRSSSRNFFNLQFLNGERIDIVDACQYLLRARIKFSRLGSRPNGIDPEL